MMKNFNLEMHHVGLATLDEDPLIELFQTLGISFGDRKDIVSQGNFIRLSSTPKIPLEIVKPYKENGIYQYLTKFSNPSSIHHIALLTDDINALCDYLIAKNIALVFPKPIYSEDGYKVNFIHPRSFYGILIELLERSRYEQ